MSDKNIQFCMQLDQSTARKISKIQVKLNIKTKSKLLRHLIDEEHGKLF